MTLNRDKILITGSGGMLGSYIDFGIRMTRKKLDVSDLDKVRSVFKEQAPSVVLHLAAATDLAKCEKSPEIAYKTNSVGTYNVALVAREIDALMVYVSTCMVFDGNKSGLYIEDDLPNPLSHYGHSKYLGELAVSGVSKDNIVVRAGWMFGGGPNKDHKFVANILKQLNESSIDVVNDKIGSPVYGKDFIDAIIKLIDGGKTGIFHIGNEGAPSRADIAREIVSITGASTKVIDVDTASLKNFSTTYASGKNESMYSHTVHLRPWQEALSEYLHTEWAGMIQKNNEN